MIATDPRFADKKTWLSSDYMFNALRTDPQNLLKRLGDGFYEQRLINEQVYQLTGQRFLASYQNDYEQYKGLMDSGIYYAKQFNLIPGVELTSSQMKELTSDMVWLVNQEIELANGQTTNVLIPKVYLAPRNVQTISHNGNGAVISAREIIGDLGYLQNEGVIAGGDSVAISAKQITHSGLMVGDRINLTAEEKLQNLGGEISAKYSASLVGKAGIEIASQTSAKAHQDEFGNIFDRGVVDRVASINLLANDGKLTLYSPQDVVIKGANLTSAGDMEIRGKHVNIVTVDTHNRTDYNADADNYYRLNQHQEVGSTLNAQGNIVVESGEGTLIRQGDIHSEQGTLYLSAEQGDIRIDSGRYQEQLSSASKYTHNGFLQSVTHTKRHEHDYDLAKGSSIDAQNIVLTAHQGGVSLVGSDMVAENSLFAAAQTISIKEAENRVFEQDFEKTSKSGLMGSSGFGFSIGSKKDSTENEQTKYYATGSQVGSLKGDTTLLATEHYQQRGSAVSSVEQDVNIVSKQVDILASEDKYNSHYKHSMEQKGLTIAVSVPIMQAVQNAVAVGKQAKQVGESKNDRINAMAAVNTAWSAYRAGEGLMKAGESLSQMANGDLAQGANVSFSITYGQQKNVETTAIQGQTATGSAINAGSKAYIKATGKDTSDINIIGSDISGKQGTWLQADNKVNLLAAQQSHQERSKNQSSGFNAGLAVSYGSNGFAFGITAGGNYGKGYGNGDEITWVNSHVGDKESHTVIKSGGETNIK